MNSTKVAPSTFPLRVFVSNPLGAATAGLTAPVLNIVDASADLISTSGIPLTTLANPGMMALSPNRAFTLVASTTTGGVAVVTNDTEKVSSTITLPGPAQSIFVASDNATAYAALPTASITSQPGSPPGAVVALNITSSTITSTVPIPGVQSIVSSHNGNLILAFGMQTQSMTLINTPQIGTNSDPRTVISSSMFDHPVWGVFSSDDTTAYIVNCGPECGGSAAGIAVLDLTVSPPQVVAAVPLPASTFALLNGATLYVSGTAASGGLLSVINLGSVPPVDTASFAITDGYHDGMTLTLDGQLFIQARNCSSACLSIVNTQTSSVTIPAMNGNVTCILPITGRDVVYVCQDGTLQIYDTPADSLQATQVDIVGQATDAVLVDAP